MIRIGFFGTPTLSAQVLQDFLDSSEFDVVFVVTGEDKAIGRHQVLTTNPVKTLALDHNLPIFQPSRIRDNQIFLDAIQSYEADYFVVVAYGKILPREVLSIPRKYPINIHGSILPKYRWASPIQASLIAWEHKTGVTIMIMNEKMDEWDIVDIKEINIHKHETTETLFQKFADISGIFARETILRLEAWTIAPQPQNHAEATFCKKITKEEWLLKFQQNAEELYHLYQGLTPWPGIFTMYHGKKLIIENCFYEDYSDAQAKIGTVVRFNNNIWIICSKWILTLSQLKLEWKKSQFIHEFLNGQQSFIGSTLPN